MRPATILKYYPCPLLVAIFSLCVNGAALPREGLVSRGDDNLVLRATSDKVFPRDKGLFARNEDELLARGVLDPAPHEYWLARRDEKEATADADRNKSKTELNETTPATPHSNSTEVVTTTVTSQDRVHTAVSEEHGPAKTLATPGPTTISAGETYTSQPTSLPAIKTGIFKRMFSSMRVSSLPGSSVCYCRREGKYHGGVSTGRTSDNPCHAWYYDSVRRSALYRSECQRRYEGS